MSISDRLDQIETRADKATDTVNEYLGDTIYACSRDHSAWGHGTMGLDDFYLACNDSTISESLVGATANADAPALVAALRAVLDLHEPVLVYELRDEFGGFALDDDGERKIVTTLCRECSSEDAMDSVEDCEWTENWAPEVQHPCLTVRAVHAALGEGS